MPILRVKEIRNMQHEERVKKLDELRTELQRLKTMIKAGGTIENPARIRALRKTVARILTIDTEPKPEPEKKPKIEPKPQKKRTRAKANVKEKKKK
jgi:large subunit ribosomal protein L29